MPSNVIGFKINNTIHKYDHDHLANIPTTDNTLTESGVPADAKATGEIRDDVILDESTLLQAPLSIAKFETYSY